MYVKELWRYPVKSMGGERLESADITSNGVAGDRLLHVRGPRGCSPDGLAMRCSGCRRDRGGRRGAGGWSGVGCSATAELVRAAAGASAELVRYAGPSVSTSSICWSPLTARSRNSDTTCAVCGRTRIGGVPGLAERGWPGRALRIGGVLIGMLKLRSRCIVTTIDPDTGEQDLDVLRTIRHGYDGTFALDSWTAAPGTIRVGDEVELVELDPGRVRPRPGGWIVGAPYLVG